LIIRAASSIFFFKTSADKPLPASTISGGNSADNKKIQIN
jgi:hypothetical protein